MSSNSYNNQEMDQLKLNKIKRIIEAHFDEEINYKKLELETIDDVNLLEFFSFLI